MTLTDKFLAIFQRDAILFFAIMLTGIVIARELGPDLMGIWTILLLIPGYAEAAGRTQYDQSAVYFMGKKVADLREITFILHLTALASVIIIGGIFLSQFEWFYHRLFTNIGPDVRILAATIFLVFPLRLVFLNYSYLALAQEDIKGYNLLVMIQALATGVLSIFLIVVLNLGISGAVAGSLAGVSISVIYAAIVFRQNSSISFKLNERLFRSMGKYASKLYLSNVIAYLQNNITSLISAIFLSPSQVAFYVLGKTLCDVSTRMVPAAINTALFPHLSRLEDDDESALLVAYLFRVTLLIVTGSSLILSLAIKPVVELLYGADYFPIIVPFLVMIPGIIFAQAAVVFSTFFSGLGRPDLLPKASILPLLLQVLLSTALIPSYGVLGAAFSHSASLLLFFCIQAILFMNLSKMSLYRLIPGQDDIRSIYCGVLSRLERHHVR